MAAVTLSGVYLAPVADLGNTLRLNAALELSEELDARVEFRPYAAGRVRLVKRTGRDRAVQVSVRRVDRATREQLDAWAGVLLLLRDGRGRKVFGAYGTPRFEEQPGLAYCDVQLTLVQVTVSEAV